MADIGGSLSEALQPLFHGLCRTVFRVPHLHRQAGQDLCLRLQLTDRIVRAAVSGAHVGVEGDDRLSGEIILVKEGVNDHREGVPPHGIPDVDRVVGIDIDLIFDRRALILVVLLLCQAGQSVVMIPVAVVRDGRLDLLNIRAGLLCDLLGYDLCSTADT